jgi:hypothetical protein
VDTVTLIIILLFLILLCLLPGAAWRVIYEVLGGLFFIGLVTWIWPDYTANPEFIVGTLIIIGFNAVRAIKTPKTAKVAVTIVEDRGRISGQNK